MRTRKGIKILSLGVRDAKFILLETSPLLLHLPLASFESRKNSQRIPRCIERVGVRFILCE
jgi:hypothetical protein